MNKNNRAFTLIELLVVVLIIGILAAVALPQYNKAVAKTRGVEIIANLTALQKAMDVYLLENGYDADVIGSDIIYKFDIGFNCAGSPCKTADGTYYTAEVANEEDYNATISARSYGSPSNLGLQIFLDKMVADGTWRKTCYWGEGMPSEVICKSLFQQGDWLDGGEW